MSEVATTDARLRTLIERVERLSEDKAAVMEDMKEVFLEAKGEGYDPKIMKKVVRLRKMARDARMQEESLLEVYKAAVGLD
jgi:uncharacterized protein (UPF0335 family)